MKVKETYIDMPYASRQQKIIWKYFNKPGQHCNKYDRYSSKWKPQVHSFQSTSGPKQLQDRDDIMWEKIKFHTFDSIEADCDMTNSFECKKRRLYKCPAPNQHFPADVEDKELVGHLMEFHPKDYEEFLESVKLTLENKIEFDYNKNSKNLKLSHGMISKNKKVILRFPLSRKNPTRHDNEEDDDDSLVTTIKKAYKINPVGAYAGNYDRPIGSHGFKTDVCVLPDKFENFVSYRHNTPKSCYIFDVNLNKYKALDIHEKIDSYIIKEEVIAPKIVGPVTDINKESVIYTCRKNGCQIPCLCQICVQQTRECNAHTFKHPALFDKMKDHILLRTPHNFDINDFKEGNTFKQCFVKNKNYVFDKHYLGYYEPVEEVYLYAGIKKDCTDCTNDLYYHSAYHFIYHDKCKFCRYSSYRFEGIRTQKEFCERVEERLLEEKSSCHLCYKIFSSEKIKKNHIKIIHQKKGDYLCDSCGRVYGSVIALEYHLSNQHKNKEQWMCKLCNNTFNLKHSLNVHVNNVHGMKTFQCKNCSRVFKRISHLIRHKKYVHGIYRSYFILDEYPDVHYHDCDHCSFKSRYKNNLLKHIETIHKDIEFPCITCEFKSNRKDNLQRHINTVHGDAKYKCNECEFITNRMDNFVRHTDTVHGDEEIFFCPECDCIFKRNNEKKRHLETVHTVEFKYSCPECDFEFKRRDEMKRHVETAHNEEFKYSCNECDFQSKSRDHMKRHVETAHTMEFKYSCNECDFQSKRRDHMKRHVETAHVTKEFKYSCNECNHVSNRKDNMKSHVEAAHTEEFKYSCNECDYVSNRNQNLKRHVEKVHKNDKTKDLDEDIEGSLNQTWVKRKSLNETFVRGKRENYVDLDGDFDKTWLPNNKDEDETI